MLVLEAVEHREVKPNLLYRVLGPRFGYRKGLSIENTVLLFLIHLNLFFDPLRLYSSPKKINI